MKATLKILAFAMPVIFAASALAKPNFTLECDLDMSAASAHESIVDYVTLFSSTGAPVEIFGSIGEVPFGYEDYGAILTNTPSGISVVMMDHGKPVRTELIPYSKPNFNVSAKIAFERFDQLHLRCREQLPGNRK
jgi:hypothetical protein